MIKCTLEEGIIKYAASTLAGIKCGSLFTFFHDDQKVAVEAVKRVNRELNERDVYIEILRFKENSALIYIYRKESLQIELNNLKTQKLLQAFGYSNNVAMDCIHVLKKKLNTYDDFPHEIGVFLNYPIEDVIGFIKNKGNDCKCIGTWKVYGDISKSKTMFRKFNYCTLVYTKLYSEGRSLGSMTVKKRLHYVGA